MSPLRSLIIALALATLLGCASGGRPAGTSGFLLDYSMLAKGKADQARLVYIRPETDLSAYDFIIVDPVVVWDATRGAPAVEPSKASLEQADYFQQVLRKNLQDVYQLSETEQRRALRFRTAIVEGLGSGVNIECELADAMSGERLIAAVDQRKLPKAAGSTDARSEAKHAYDRWAEIIRNRLATLRDFDASLQEAGD